MYIKNAHEAKRTVGLEKRSIIAMMDGWEEKRGIRGLARYYMGWPNRTISSPVNTSTLSTLKSLNRCTVNDHSG